MPTSGEQEALRETMDNLANNRCGHISKILASMFYELHCHDDEANMHLHT